MSKLRQAAQRVVVGVTAAAFILTIAGQLLPMTASASQVTGRSITMSSSAPSATSVTYTVNFTAITAETHPDVVINFCNASSDPIPGDTCSGTAGTDVPNVSAAAASGWTVTAIDSNKSIKLTTTTNSFSASTAITPIVITGITNGSNTGTTGSFYGRILVFANGGASGYTSPTSPGSYVDYGGIALSNSSNILITSKVFETLSFCVFQSSCGTQANLALGASGTGALSTTTAYDNNNAQYTIATNAGSGVTMTMTGTTLCRPGGTCPTGAGGSVWTITAIGSSPATVTTPGSEQFGMCVDSNALPGGTTVATTYLDSTANNCHTGVGTGAYAGGAKFGFNDVNTTSSAGDTVLSSTGAIASYTGTFVFAANISATTESGLYSTSLNLVATGKF